MPGRNSGMNLREALARMRQPFGVAAPAREALPVAAATGPALDPTRCRYCGGAVDGRRPGALAFGDGASGHLACYEQAEAAPRPNPTLKEA
jgi:hypothetical protein